MVLFACCLIEREKNVSIRRNKKAVASGGGRCGGGGDKRTQTTGTARGWKVVEGVDELHVGHFESVLVNLNDESWDLGCMSEGWCCETSIQLQQQKIECKTLNRQKCKKRRKSSKNKEMRPCTINGET